MGLLLSAFYLGYPILQLPAGMISERYGAKYIIGIAMTNCTLLTFVTPFVTTYGDWRGLWIVRFFQGLWQVNMCHRMIMKKVVFTNSESLL